MRQEKPLIFGMIQRGGHDTLQLLLSFLIGVIGLGFLSLGSVFIVGGLPRSQVITCQRIEAGLINCHSKHTTAGFVTHESRLERLQRVRIAAVAAGDEGGAGYYQVNLLGIQTNVALEHLSQDNAKNLVNKVNTLINSSTSEPITIQSDYSSWMHVLVGTLVISIVLIVVASTISRPGI